MRFLSICLPEEEQRSPMLCFSLGDQIHAKEFWWKKELKKKQHLSLPRCWRVSESPPSLLVVFPFALRQVVETAVQRGAFCKETSHSFDSSGGK